MQILQSEFTVRPYAHPQQTLVVRFSVDQHQVWFDVAIPVVFPIASLMSGRGIARPVGRYLQALSRHLRVRLPTSLGAALSIRAYSLV